jgi:hypothetical protein
MVLPIFISMFLLVLNIYNNNLDISSVYINKLTLIMKIISDIKHNYDGTHKKKLQFVLSTSLRHKR